MDQPVEWLRVSDLVRRTGMSMRYWQRQMATGRVPGTSYKQLGKRRIYLVRAAGFDAWWREQLVEVNATPSHTMISPEVPDGPPIPGLTNRWIRTASRQQIMRLLRPPRDD